MHKRLLYILAFGIIPFVLIGIMAFSNANSQENPESENMNVTFVNINQPHIRKSFIEVLETYKKLHSYEITLIQEELKLSTMQAQPIINLGNLFGKKKHYKIQLAETVRDAEDLIIAEVPEDVLKGWFAHELGHIVDYEIRSNMSMVGYGLRYKFSDKFKKACEHQADSIAIEHGFHEEIIATKRYLLEHELIPEAYKAKLRKYYMPISGVEMCLKENSPIKPTLDL